MSANSQSRYKTGLLLAIVGMYFLLSNFGLLGWFDLGKLWPVVLIGLGLVLIFKK